MSDAIVKTSEFYYTCVACGARYHPKWLVGVNPMAVVPVSNHHCDPKRLAKREEELRHEFDDPENYCECDDLDCKFEYIESLMNDME